jgi:plastocyanin
MQTPTPLRVIITALALIAAIVAVACFSERQASTGPNLVVGDCRIAVGSPIVGSTQALVALRNYGFHPDTLRVKPGTAVTWINCEPETVEPHTSNAENGEWHSGYLAPGTSYSRTFQTAGRFDYFCEPHPFMKGVVIVE